MTTQGLGSQISFVLSPTQGTTVRVITAIDQDKGRPRGIGYTIVSGKALVPWPSTLTAGVPDSAGLSRGLGVWTVV